MLRNLNTVEAVEAIQGGNIGLASVSLLSNSHIIIQKQTCYYSCQKAPNVAIPALLIGHISTKTDVWQQRNDSTART